MIAITGLKPRAGIGYSHAAAENSCWCFFLCMPSSLLQLPTNGGWFRRGVPCSLRKARSSDQKSHRAPSHQSSGWLTCPGDSVEAPRPQNGRLGSRGQSGEPPCWSEAGVEKVARFSPDTPGQHPDVCDTMTSLCRLLVRGMCVAGSGPRPRSAGTRPRYEPFPGLPSPAS